MTAKETAAGQGAPAGADSMDGREFVFAAPDHLAVEAGDFVTLNEGGGRRHIGQIYELAEASGGQVRCRGKILGVVRTDGGFESRRSYPFRGATVATADAEAIELVYAAAGATLHVGSFMDAADIRARLMPHRFNRHTFWCGQSGSGKTYALGVLLEQLLITTRLPMVIFDPNADFVRMREAHPHAEGAGRDQQALAERDIRILRPGAPDPGGLYVRFTDLPMPAKAAVLHLDPLVDRTEYNELLHLEETLGSQDASVIVPTLRSRGDAAAMALAARVENLRLIDWGVWAMGHRAVTDILDTRPDATVLDLGGFAFPDEYLVVAMAVLDDLWAKREQRRPILLVIDEAHNLCSPDHDTPLHTAVRERIIQIAAEGRKFGLWLLLSTQRPSRIHPSIISQCDNLALMKMSSTLDLQELGTIFGYAPGAMLNRSPTFKQGEALFAGGFVPAPSLIRLGGRLTREGGSDVAVPLRQARP